MTVARKSVEGCIGCGNCANICPMDVFYFDYDANKSVCLYPENCQSCGQCYLACLGDVIIMLDTAYEFAPTPMRGLRTFAQFMPEEEEEDGKKG